MLQDTAKLPLGKQVCIYIMRVKQIYIYILQVMTEFHLCVQL